MAMNRKVQRLGALTIALGCASALTLGCESGPPKTPVKPTQPGADAGTAAPAAADAGAAAPASADAGAAALVEGGPCKAYADRFCKELGEQSPTCASFKQASDLMAPSACEAGLKDIEISLGKIKDLSKKCEELVDRLCKGLGEETQTCAMVRDKTKEFPPDRCGMMLEHFDEVLADLKRQEDMNKPLSAEQQTAMNTEGKFYGFGPEDAKVTVVEFSDFECPYCSRAAEVTNQIKAKYNTQIRFIFRQFPLSFHKNAHLAHQAAMAAGDQGKFWEYHDKLFANQKALERESLDKYAQELGLNMAKFKADLDNTTFAKFVDADMALGQKVTVQGTPTMFINGERVANASDFEAISSQIDKALGVTPAPQAPVPPTP